jgi:hypothetical protein
VEGQAPGKISRARTSKSRSSSVPCSSVAFNLPAGDFFRGLSYYYRLELVHLVPNSIIVL